MERRVALEGVIEEGLGPACAEERKMSRLAERVAVLEAARADEEAAMAERTAARSVAAVALAEFGA